MNSLSYFSFIFIGDTHGFISDFKKQKQIINNVNPQFVLSEQLQDIILDSKEKYVKILRNKKISEMVSFKEVQDLIELCYKKGIKLIDMDLRNFGFDSKLQATIKNGKKVSKKDEIKIDSIIKKRQLRQLEIIKKYKSIATKPLVIILGTWHLQENSILMNSLNNYIVIYPCDNNGSILLKPSKKKIRITYCRRIKK